MAAFLMQKWKIGLRKGKEDAWKIYSHGSMLFQSQRDNLVNPGGVYYVDKEKTAGGNPFPK